jgi:hypothetical protein
LDSGNPGILLRYEQVNKPIHEGRPKVHNVLQTNRLIAQGYVAGALLLAIGCEGEAKKDNAAEVRDAKAYVAFAEFVNPEDSLPRLRYLDDGLVSVNERCAVRKVRLNPNMPPAYVNGRPIGFC